MSLHGRLRGGNDRRPITVQNRDWIVIGFYIARIVIGFLVLVFALVRRNSIARPGARDRAKSNPRRNPSPL